MNGFFYNLDLFSVGIATASTGILGFVVFLNNRKSITNKTFLAFSVVTIIWGIANYLHYQTRNPIFALWALRTVFFFAVWQSFTIFQLFYVFPKEQIAFPKKYKFILVPIVFLTSLITLTPLVSSEVIGFSPEGVPENTKGPGIIIFGIVATGLVLAALYTLFKKIRDGTDTERTPLKIMRTGIVLMFGLIIPLNFILPAFFEKFLFLPQSAVFTLPFVVLTSYTILRHHLFGAKVIATEILTFILAAVTLFEVLTTQGVAALAFRISVFVMVLSFGILLIRSVRKEVEQRERLEVLTKQLGEANEELKKLDAAKSEFVSIASHQLRAPLTVIRGFVSLVLEGSYGAVSDAIKEALGKVAYSTVQLVKLVSDLLNLSRIEAGKIRYEMAQNDFLDTVKKVVEEFQPNAEKKGLRLAFVNSAGALSPFIFDADKVREVAVNLTDNAIKYSQQGEVKITLEKSAPDRVRLSIKDQGLGIKKEDLGRLFTKFIRTEDARLQDPNGMGIGLYFVKRVMDDHGGSVGVESEGLGKGSTFWVELPIK